MAALLTKISMRPNLSEPINNALYVGLNGQICRHHQSLNAGLSNLRLRSSSAPCCALATTVRAFLRKCEGNGLPIPLLARFYERRFAVEFIHDSLLTLLCLVA